MASEGEGNWPKASIGNYKGVMLCNRPNEFGQVQKPQRQGQIPFNSRVRGTNDVGLNPTKKNNLDLTVTRKKKVDPNSILVRHKRFLKTLEAKMQDGKELKSKEAEEKKEKFDKLKTQAEKQRQKIKQLKHTPEDAPTIEEQEEPKPVKKSKLTAANLVKNEKEIERSEQASRAASRKAEAPKPEWAKTAENSKKEKEDEIDDLIDFAYELDYEQYMEDMEVRQALELIKQRVGEMKKDEQWKDKMEDDHVREQERNERIEQIKKERREECGSVADSQMSTQSRKDEIMDQIKAEQAGQPEWDNYSQAESRKDKNPEELLASRLAKEILMENPNLKNVHSKTSMKMLLEKEAKKEIGFNYVEPVIATHKDHEQITKINPSTLPYLHKNPAI